MTIGNIYNEQRTVTSDDNISVDGSLAFLVENTTPSAVKIARMFIGYGGHASIEVFQDQSGRAWGYVGGMYSDSITVRFTAADGVTPVNGTGIILMTKARIIETES